MKLSKRLRKWKGNLTTQMTAHGLRRLRDIFNNRLGDF